MQYNHPLYKIQNGRTTFFLCLFWVLFWGVCLYLKVCDFKFFSLMLMLISFAFSFRKAIK